MVRKQLFFFIHRRRKTCCVRVSGFVIVHIRIYHKVRNSSKAEEKEKKKLKGKCQEVREERKEWREPAPAK